MNEGSIWWEQIGTSRRFLKDIQENMEAANSVVLHIPAKLPWKNYFYTMVDMQRASFSADRQMQRLEWIPGMDPGQLILERLCTRFVRADYFPGQTYAEYLGSRDDILLCDYYVWITGIDSREDLNRWIEFISQYNEFSKNFTKRAIYVLEYTGSSSVTGSVTCLSFPLEQLDHQVFCLELSSALHNATYRFLQSEMARRVGGDDPELTALLIAAGEPFVLDPVAVTSEIISSRRRSDYSRFEPMSSKQISSAVWKAHIVLLFPILEQWRYDLILKYQEGLRAHLPIKNSNGDKIEEPFDLELGPLLFLAAQNRIFTPVEYEQLKLCRSVRNKLAHNTMVPTEEAYAVLSL